MGVLSKLPEVPEHIGFSLGTGPLHVPWSCPSIYCSFSSHPEDALAEQDLAQSGPCVVSIQMWA